MKRIFLALCLLVSISLSAQTMREQYERLYGELRFGPGKDEAIPYGEKGYTLLLPRGNVKALIVSLQDRRADTSAARVLQEAALQEGLGFLYVSGGIPVDLYLDDAGPRYADSVLRTVLQPYKKLPVFFLGVNLSGHRALRYLRYLDRAATASRPNVKGIVLCDGVLDWVRMWYECRKAVRDAFAESSVFEGKLVTYLLEKNIGGTPRDREEAYLELSPYSYFDTSNRHLHLLKDVAVRAYSEPATDYWMQVKAKTVFDTNFPDMVGIVNELKRIGHKNAELVLFHQERSLMDRRNPDYTWRLADKRELVSWMLRQLDR